MVEQNPNIDKERLDTWPKWLVYNCGQYRDRPAFRYKSYGIWQICSWKDYYTNVKNLALGLLSSGMVAGDRVLIVGDNAPQWYFSALASQSNKGVIIGVSPELSAAELEFIAGDVEAGFAIVQGQEQVDTFLEIIDKLPRLKKIIYWNYKGLSNYSSPCLTGFREVLDLGRQFESGKAGIFEMNINSGKSDDNCTIIYSSGTNRSNPRGAVHTYRTMNFGAEYLLNLDSWRHNDNVIFSLSPVGVIEQWLGIGCHLLAGNTLNFAEQKETQAEDFREIGPDIMYYPAQLWESLAGSVKARAHNASAIERLAFRLFMPAVFQTSLLTDENKNHRLWSRLTYALANILLLSPIKNSLGLSKTRVFRTTGGAISPETINFYRSLNINLKNIYSTAECGGICGVAGDDMCLDTMGSIPSGAEIRISDSGELLCRHAGIFTGYCRDEGDTTKFLKNGWFHTGDLAAINEEGYVIYQGCKQDTSELACGYTVSPQLIESRLKTSPYIKDAWLLPGSGKDFLAAVIIINFNNVSKWADSKKIVYTTFSDLSQKPAVYELITQGIRRINQTLPEESRIKKYMNLYKEFDPDEGELTRTGKLRRWFLIEHYSQLIDAVYSDKSELPIEMQIQYRDGRIGKIKTTIKINTVEEEIAS